MSKWIAEFELEDGDRMPEHMDLNYKGAKIDFYCRPLEQEPCEDVVSRKTIDQNIYDYAESNGLSYANLKNAILDAPSVTLTQRWIPVTERLPEESTAVLVWCPERKDIYCAYYEEKRWWIFGAYWEQIGMEIIAWMPLPQPYKAKSEG